jgi:type III restriction enzyme
MGTKNDVGYNFIGVRLKEKGRRALDNSGISILNLRLKTILDTLEDVEEVWYAIDLSPFSSKKKLFDYQKNALENAIKGLYYFYSKCGGNKEEFFENVYKGILPETLPIRNKKITDLLKEGGFVVNENKLPTYQVINRMGFWMATGSGKTLVIVKLIELLSGLMNLKLIPQKDILFLTHRDDLIGQFKGHVKDFNEGRMPSKTIQLYELKDYEDVKSGLDNPTGIPVFYYRADLFDTEEKEKRVNFRNYLNDGNWYLILDEAHKGDKDESKRQTIFNILCKNGFRFDFSATFTEEIDFITCAYNFNLAEFVKQGYGKHIYVSGENLRSFSKTDDFSPEEKQKILLKIFILLTGIIKAREKVKDRVPYHKPLLLVLVNSVNVEDSDMELFFRELANIAKGEIQDSDFQGVKDELIQELEKANFQFENVRLSREFLNLLREITFEDLLEDVFNSKSPGTIEVVQIPQNRQELLFKLKSGDKPFALMKIGDITPWLREKLEGYEIVERFEEENIFAKLNEDEDINILMGSRAFYEGWDSNRPNVIAFINIGMGEDAKKFVLQSIGRGVRIEPFKNIRRRLEILHKNSQIDISAYQRVKDWTTPIESLFVFGTKASNLETILQTLREQRQEEEKKNPKVQGKLLLVPEYEESRLMLIDRNRNHTYPLNPEDKKIAKEILELDDRVLVCMFDVNPKVLAKLKKDFDALVHACPEERRIGIPEVVLKRLFGYFSMKFYQATSFRELDREKDIIHFRHIRLSESKLNSIKEKIEKVKAYRDSKRLTDELVNKLKRGEITNEEFRIKYEGLPKEEETTGGLIIRYLATHYYIPIILTQQETINYIMHVIRTQSEVEFINELSEKLRSNPHLFDCDWWMFSKIDETLDNVYIPYYNSHSGRIERFKPDFIFWFRKGCKYLILFLDPKGTEHTANYRKIDGYKELFEENGEPKTFAYEEECGKMEIRVILRLWNRRLDRVPEAYTIYYVAGVDKLVEEVKRLLS